MLLRDAVVFIRRFRKDSPAESPATTKYGLHVIPSDLIRKPLKASAASHRDPHNDRPPGHTALSADPGLFSF